jgi:hypothetical protein
MAHHSNGKVDASLRNFKFIDQNNQSREAATVSQSLVRSHVMTEIRRLKRSKAKIRKESGIHIMAQLISNNPDGEAAAPDSLDTFDKPSESDSNLADPSLSSPVNNDKWAATIGSHDETRNFQYASGSRARTSTALSSITPEIPVFSHSPNTT